SLTSATTTPSSRTPIADTNTPTDLPYTMEESRQKDSILNNSSGATSHSPKLENHQLPFPKRPT
ncbi:Hypothetical predicted protein, partial [Pelobates cultripes]